MADKKMGRPAKYTEAQVMEGIEFVERDGGTPTGETVKSAMCAHLNVPDGINALCLDKEVQRLVAERERERRERLVAALPETTRAVVKEIGAMVESAVLVHLGQEHENLRTTSSRAVAASGQYRC